MKSAGFVAITFFALGAVETYAQSTPLRVAITYVEGSTYIDGNPAPRPGSVVPENAVVRTGKGRAQILFGRGDTMFLGEDSSVRVNHNSDTDSVELEILSGSAVVITGGLGPAVACVQETQLSDAGIFRFDVHRAVGETFCHLKVFRGAAATKMPSFIWVLTTGKAIDLNRSCGDHTPRDEFNVAEIDGLDCWSRERGSMEVGH